MDGDPLVLRPPRVPVPAGNRHSFDAHPAHCIEVFHLHCHFDDTTESLARALLASTKGAVEAAFPGGAAHDHIWHEKNGPHIANSWEVWVESIAVLGVAVHHLMRNRSPSLHVCLHCDTDQEYTDHAARMAFIGPEDDLDLEFFTPPDPSSYRGPQGPRQSCEAFIYSMGERWSRADLGKSYGAMDRTQHQGAEMSIDGSGLLWRGERGQAVLPSLFLPHGSPPIPIERCASETWLLQAARSLPVRPRAIVFMSPHYMRSTFTVSTCPAPATLMDFDDDTDPAKLQILEGLQYPCPGHPALAKHVAELIRGSGIPCEENEHRGLDHGVWTPLYVMYPEADIPVISLSVGKSLDAEVHIRVGRALAPLAAQGVLLVGSGEVVHNVPLMAKGQPPKQWCTDFEGWLEGHMAAPAGPSRDHTLALFREAPGAAVAHPTAQVWPAERQLPEPFSSPGEHLMPWYFAYGAAGPASNAKCVFKEYLGSLPMAAYRFDPADELPPAKL